jgi:hypothetical protein
LHAALGRLHRERGAERFPTPARVLVDAGDLDPAQLLELDTLVTGHDPVAVREAVLTAAREVGRPGGLAQGTDTRVVLAVRQPLCRNLRMKTDAQLDELALAWELRSWGADWTARRYAGLLRSLAILAESARAERRGVYVRFDV